MQRIDGPTASAALPAPRPVGTGVNTPGYFQDGDPLTGTPPTTLDHDWANMVQEELVGIVLAGGLAPSKTDHGQVLAALHGIFVAVGGSSDIVIGATEVSLPLPGGFILKFGTVSGSYTEQQLSHSFGAAFPAKCWVVIPVAINLTGSFTRDVWAQRVLLSAAGFTLFMQWKDGGSTSNSSDGVDFIAIGN